MRQRISSSCFPTDRDPGPCLPQRLTEMDKLWTFGNVDKWVKEAQWASGALCNPRVVIDAQGNFSQR
jgi:hypothetical protein